MEGHLRVDRYSLLALLLAALVLGQAAQSEAQCAAGTEMTCNRVGADGKGILGLGIIGAEIGFMIPALIVSAGVRELDEWWAYVLFPVLGATGGAVAGYFALEEPNGGVGFPEVAVAMFAVGMALIVPTFVGVLALTSYGPGPSDGGGQGATGEEDADAPGAAEPEADESAQSSAVRRTLAGGPGLIRFDRSAVLLGVPMVHSRDSFTSEEREHMNLGQMADLNVPIVSGVW